MRLDPALMGLCMLSSLADDVTTLKKNLYRDSAVQTADDRKQFRRDAFRCIRSMVKDCEQRAREDNCDNNPHELKTTVLQVLDYLDVLAEEDRDDWRDEEGAVMEHNLNALLK